MKKVHQLRESSGSKPTKVDWENGIIYGVKVLAESSRNGFVYPRSTREKAHKILENLRVNLDHLTKGSKSDVPLAARFGKLINVREGANGTYADLRFNVEHKYAKSIAYAAEHMPDTLGMSINGIGYGTKKDGQGRTIVDEINRLRSCDVVADPGSTHSLFESAPVEPEVVEPAGPSPSIEGIRAEINTLLDQSSEDEAVLDALQELIDKRRGKKSDETDDDETGEHVPVEESDKSELARLKTEKACLVLCESLKVNATAELIGLLADLPSDDKRKLLLATVKKTPAAAPRSAPAKPVDLRESAPVDPVAERKRLAKLLRS